MKKSIYYLTLLLTISFISYGQDSAEKNLPELFKFFYETPEYIYGDVKEIQYSTFDAIMRDGNIVLTGKLITNSPSQALVNYSLNQLGQVFQMNVTNLSGDWTGILNYEEDKIGNVFWLKNDTLLMKWDYTYPNKNKVERKDFNVTDNTMNGVEYYEVDDHGLIMNQVVNNNKGEQQGFSIKYERDDTGAISNKQTIAPDGKITGHFDGWEYDDQGQKHRVHRSVERRENVDRYGATHTYEYDEKGNWIKRTSVNPNNHNIRVTERSFVFY